MASSSDNKDDCLLLCNRTLHPHGKPLDHNPTASHTHTIDPMADLAASSANSGSKAGIVNDGEHATTLEDDTHFYSPRSTGQPIDDLTPELSSLEPTPDALPDASDNMEVDKGRG